MAKSTYTFDLTKAVDVQKAEKLLYLFASFWNTKEFRSFIADKCLKELAEICNYLPPYAYLEHSVFDEYVAKYINNHKKEIGKDYVLIFNDTTIQQDEMWWVSPKTRLNYPDGLSVAYIIEYGTGLLGLPADDWELNVGDHDEYYGWRYINPDTGRLKQTQGLEAQLVYFQLMEAVKKHFQEWVEEYADKLF